MKKNICFLLLGIILCFCGCKKEEQNIELLSVSQELFVYEQVEEHDAFAVDEEGKMYTTLSCPWDNGGKPYTEAERQPDYQQITVYDTEGNQLEQTMVEMGSGNVQSIFSEGNLLYCAVGKSVFGEEDGSAVYTLNTDTWEVTEIVWLTELQLVRNMVRIGDYLYVFGMAESPEAKNYALHPDVIGYNYLGNVVGRVDLNATEDGMLLFNVDFPEGIFGTNDGTLGIYQYTEENGFTILTYSPEEGTLTETGMRQDTTAAQCFISCEDGCIFLSGNQLYFGTPDGGQTQISSEWTRTLKQPVYQNGFVFYKNWYTDKIERICIGNMLQNNKAIKLLMHADIMDKPFGCGYRMDQLVLASEQFALKALAQDRDFDLYLLSSRDPSSYNLKKNGAFYPLNEVEGVQEYLDACFPYLKETAVNEEGDIWMVPVGLAIRGLMYNKEYCEENRVDLEAMDFMEFLTFTQETEREYPEKTSISTMCVMEELFGRYLKNYGSFDTEVFRSYAKKLKEIRDEQGYWGMDYEISNGLFAGNIPDAFYEYEVYAYSIAENARRLGNSDAIGLLGMPGITENEGNLGTLTFLAVNPQSENLETTLEYISAFAKFMLTKKDSFLLEDYSTYTDTPFRKDWYELYKNGSVYFEMDREVYWNMFSSYLGGEIELEAMITEIERCRKMYMEE